MSSEHIITLLEALESDNINAQQRADLEMVTATLRLWENSQACTSRVQLAQALENSISNNHTTILVIDRFDSEILNLVQSAHPHKVEIILLTSSELPPQILGDELMKTVNHFVSVSQGRLATTSLVTAIKKISSRELYGIGMYLAYGTPLNYFVMSRSEDRSWFVDRFMRYVSGLEGIIPYGTQEFSRMTGEVLDELLMNAIWDANPRRNNISRNTPVILEDSEGVHIEWGVDGNTLAVGVRDPFGTLKKDTFFRYQDEVLGIKKTSQVVVNANSAGAGIGLHMMLRRASGLVVNTTEGFATEVIALFDLARSTRSIQKTSKTLHYFIG